MESFKCACVFDLDENVKKIILYIYRERYTNVYARIHIINLTCID